MKTWSTNSDPSGTASIIPPPGPRRSRDARRASSVETHISWVLLLPQFAYKLKKPLRLPSWTTPRPHVRAHFCEEEVRLNQRLAPRSTLASSRAPARARTRRATATGRSWTTPCACAAFPEAACSANARRRARWARPTSTGLRQMLAASTFGARHARCGGRRALPARLAALDGSAAVAASRIAATCARGIGRARRTWIRSGARVALTAMRASATGDLHLANLLELDGEVAAFDCVEFDAGLRCIDAIEDACVRADGPGCALACRGWPRRFINAWLERTGRVRGRAGLRLCLVYRALVRATVGCCGGDEAGTPVHICRRWRGRGPRPPVLADHARPARVGQDLALATLAEAHAASASAPTSSASACSGWTRWRIRERGHGDLRRDATQRTYARLFALARLALQAGWPVVLDAAFLRSRGAQAPGPGRLAGRALLHPRLRGAAGRAARAAGAAAGRCLGSGRRGAGQLAPQREPLQPQEQALRIAE
jgi:hypothetical protein